jgi:nitrous oxidase accessory protein
MKSTISIVPATGDADPLKITVKRSGLIAILFFCTCFPHSIAWAAEISTSQDLVRAVEEGEPGEVIRLAAGRFVLNAPLKPKEGMTIEGAGIGETLLVGADSWKPETDTLPGEDDPEAFLFSLDRIHGVKISGMTLTGQHLHGAVYGNRCENVELFDLKLEKFLWSAVRTYGMSDFRVHDCEFLDAGGRYGHTTGGALFMHWSKDSEFWNNRIAKTEDASNFYGFKGYGGRGCRIHHNTVLVNFSIEFPHDNNHHMEIDHNRLAGCVSIPKHSGGSVPETGHTFHIHHNWFEKTYSLEWPRNAVEVDHNLFDFSTEDDGGNLISRFGDDVAPGPTRFHDNLIKNPGRGVFWSRGIYNHFHFYNNQVIAHTTATPREDGLFGFHGECDFETIEIENNIIACVGLPRPLVRNEASYGAKVANNTLINIADAEKFENPETDEPRGLTAPLRFRCGADGEFIVLGWEALPYR